jgi:predicted RNA-binding protein YlxR (DUF448 family)
MTLPFVEVQPSSDKSSSYARKFKRRCIVCKLYFERSQLFRMVKVSSTECRVYPPTVASSLLAPPFAQGRSAYVCTTLTCRNRIHLQKGRALSHALKTSLSSTMLETLTNALQTSP